MSKSQWDAMGVAFTTCWVGGYAFVVNKHIKSEIDHGSSSPVVKYVATNVIIIATGLFVCACSWNSLKLEHDSSDDPSKKKEKEALIGVAGAIVTLMLLAFIIAMCVTFPTEKETFRSCIICFGLVAIVCYSLGAFL